MAEYNKLSGDYAEPRQRTLTEESSTSRSTISRNPLGSGSSVSSKLSRSSRKLVKNTPELGEPLTASLDDDHDEAHRHESNGRNLEGNSKHEYEPSNGKTGFIEDDPFYIFRGDLVKKLVLVDDELRRYLNIVRTTDTAVNTHEIKESKKQLKRHIKHAESTVADLETTVRVVEKQRDKFPHIDDAEVAERRSFVDSSKDRISRAKSGMQSEEVKRKFAEDERALGERRREQLNPGAGSPTKKKLARQNSLNGEDAKFLEEGRSETLMMMQRQDETLDDLDMAVTRVGYMAETIHEEIGHQNKMLKDLEEDLADAEEQLGMVMGKLAKLLKTKNKCQIGFIIILSLIVLLLFFLVIYT